MAGGRVSHNRVIVEGFIDFDYEITLLTCVHAARAAQSKRSSARRSVIVQVHGDYVESWQPHPMHPCGAGACAGDREEGHRRSRRSGHLRRRTVRQGRAGVVQRSQPAPARHRHGHDDHPVADSNSNCTRARSSACRCRRSSNAARRRRRRSWSRVNPIGSCSRTSRRYSRSRVCNCAFSENRKCAESGAWASRSRSVATSPTHAPKHAPPRPASGRVSSRAAHLATRRSNAIVRGPLARDLQSNVYCVEPRSAAFLSLLRLPA